MSRILFDPNGLPIAISSNLFFSSTRLQVQRVTEKPSQVFEVNGVSYVNWGDNNRYPDDAVMTIGRTGVLSTAVGFKCRTSFGQGVVAMQSTGYDEDGEEVLKPCKIQEVNDYLSGYTFIRYASTAFRDLFKFGNAFPIFYFNEKGDIVNIICRNARHCRISQDKRKLLVYPDFRNGSPNSDSECEVIDMLDEDDPFTDLMTRKASSHPPKGSIAFPRLQNYYSNTDYYGIPDWDAAYRSGWIDVANMVPKFLKESYNNAMTMMWHIQIPRSWYENHFPEKNYIGKEGGIEEREKDIQDFWDDFESQMTGIDGGSKTIFSEYTTNDMGRSEDKWVIERLENELDSKERLSTSAAANSEILFSMMINPSTLGAGMPGGSYAGTAGSGSDIRESYLVSVITTYIEKRQILWPVELMFLYNGHKNLKLQFKETILTTLNTGNSKEEIQS